MHFIDQLATYDNGEKNMSIRLIISIIALSVPLLQGCVAAGASGAASGVAVAADRRTVGTIVEDQSIEIKALHAMSRDPSLWKHSHINVLCYNGALLIVGQTPTEALKNQAEDTVKDIPKIERIHNELAIKAPLSLAARSRDSWITAQIKAKLIGSKSIRSTRIKVITEDNVVYLMGLTTTTEQTVATDIARAIPDVEKVVQIFEPVEDER